MTAGAAVAPLGAAAAPTGPRRASPAAGLPPAAALSAHRDPLKRTVLPKALERAVALNDKQARRSALLGFRISPDSLNKRRWEWALVLFVMYNAFSIPYGLSISPDAPVGLVVFEYCVDMLFVVDLAANFITGVEDEWGDISYDLRTIAHAYARGWLVVDLPATIPFELLALAVGDGGNIKLIALLKCPRLLRIGRLMRKLDQFAAARAVRILNLLIGFFIVAHWIGCGFYYMGTEYGDPELDPHWIDGVVDDSARANAVYVRSLYWAFATLSTVGYGDLKPVSQDEWTYATFVFIGGALVSAVVLANVTSLIEKFDQTHTLYMQRVSAVNEFFELHELPQALHDRVVEYLDALWTINGGVDFDRVSADLPRFLTSEIAMGRCAALLRAVPLFAKTDDAFVRAIVVKLQPEVCLAGDYVCYAGDLAATAYLLYKGRVTVEPGSSEEAFELTEGAFFGEAACLERGKRTHDVRAASFCYLYTLAARDFADIIADFPEYRDSIISVATARIAVARYKTQLTARLLAKNIGNKNVADMLHMRPIDVVAQAYGTTPERIDVAVRTLQTWARHLRSRTSVTSRVAFSMKLSALKKEKRRAAGGHTRFTIIRINPTERKASRVRLQKADVARELLELEERSAEMQQMVADVFKRVEAVYRLVLTGSSGSGSGSGSVASDTGSAAPKRGSSGAAVAVAVAVDG